MSSAIFSALSTFSGIRPHRNIPFCDGRKEHPRAVIISSAILRREAYVAFRSLYHWSGNARAFAAAFMTGLNRPESTFDFTLTIQLTNSGLLASMAIRHPAMLWLLLSEFISMAISIAPGTCRRLMGLSFRMKL